MQCLARTTLLKTLEDQQKESAEAGVDLNDSEPSSSTISHHLLLSLKSTLSPSPSSTPILNLLSHLHALHPGVILTSNFQQDSLEVLTYLLSHVPSHSFTCSQSSVVTCLTCGSSRPLGSSLSSPLGH
ncbi:hypothetical protein TrRE_jg1688, partial [Triparma retinervis]